MERVNLFFLHGFLGRPSDWAAVIRQLPQNEEVRVYCPDYFQEPALNPNHLFSQWSENFNAWALAQTGGQGRNILVGYSLGGRLALHALEHNSGFWDKLVLVSTNPGFNDSHSSLEVSSQERRQRWLNDSYWAEAFMTSSWEMLLRNWNAQPVFGGGDSEPVRLEQEYTRESLSLALTQWSLAQQKNLRSVLRANLSKIVWMVGERDEKFLALSQDLQREIAGFNYVVAAASSHRVLVDKPVEIATQLRLLLQ